MRLSVFAVKEMKNEKENIELRSEEVQEILGHIPSRIVRYGITSMLIVVLALFVGSFFFKYPDIVSAPFEIFTKNPPADITAKSNGNLVELFVVDSQLVFEGQKLAIIQNASDLNDVVFLQDLLGSIKIELYNAQLLVLLNDSLNLGDIQPAYTLLQKTAREYQQFKRLDYHAKKLAALRKQQSELSKYAQVLGRQVDLKKDGYRLIENQYRRDSQLFANDVISVAELERSKKVLIQEAMEVQTSQSMVINTRMELQEIQQQLIEFELQKQEQDGNYRQSLSGLLQGLENSIAQWFEQYVLLSSVAGRVAFNRIWNENQYLVAGEQVFTIIPLGEQNIIGRITLPSKGAGKVKLGQNVNLKFNNFPYQEFGMVQASVSSVSMVPLNDAYVIELVLSDTLITNYGTFLPFSQKMSGTAEIITEDVPLIVRLFNPLKAILKKYKSK